MSIADLGGAVPPRTVEVRGGGLTAIFTPDRGAKITSLHDGSREWLAQPIGQALPGEGTAFVDAEMSGWDECAPSIVACTVDGVEVPDHGSLWDVEFDISGATATHHAEGFSFSRTIEPTAHGLLLRYRAWTDRAELPFLWAAHPQFVAPPGTHVRLALPVATVVDVLHDKPRPIAWSREIAGIDGVPQGGCRKVYVDPTVAVDAATVVHPDGRELTLNWSAGAPYLGIWFDRCAYSREPVIALEPSTGYFDSLATAVRRRRVAVLRPDAPLDWWVEVRSADPLPG